MALEDLQRDLHANKEEARRMLEASGGNPALAHLLNTVWPFQEALLEELGEQAEALDEAIDQTGDILQAETAGVFAAAILASGAALDELDRRLGPSEIELRGQIVKTRELLTEASTILEEITIPPSPLDDDADDDDDDTQDDDEDDDDDDEPKSK